MRTLQSLFLFSFLLIIPFSSVDASSRTSTKLESRAYETSYFSINLPMGWIDSTDNIEEPTFVSPNLGATLSAAAIDLEEDIDYDPKLRKFWLNLFVDEYNQEFDDFKLLSSKNAKIGKLTGLRMDFKATIDGLPTEMYQIILIENGIEYVLTAGVTDKNQWKQFRPIFTKSFSTFKIN